MKKRTAFTIAFIWAWFCTAVCHADQPKGALYIIGGGLRYGNAEVWNRYIELAAEKANRAAPSPAGEIVAATATIPEKNKDDPAETNASGGGSGESVAKAADVREVAKTVKPRIAVFPTASSNPMANGRRVVDALNRYGGDAFLVPVAMRGMEVDYKIAVRDEKLVEQVRTADGVFFIGGEQRRIVEALQAEDGGRTPMLDAVWEVYKAGGAIAGTSAGAAVMSHVMCRDAERVLATLQNGVVMGKEIDRGLGFLNESWFVDQHALIRGRFARALVIMRSQGLKYGVGIDENTALEVRNGADATVIGYKGALVLDLSEAKSDDKASGFNVQNAKLTYLDRGDSINLKTLDVRPSAEKQQGQKLDPKSPDFRPTENRSLFYADVLGNTTVCDLLANLMENKNEEAIGLAFDGSAARQQSSTGFEFRFYRGDGSLGWTTGDYGGSAYTVANVRLDVRPVTITGPLYK